VEYEVGFFAEGAEEVRAVAALIHVFVDRKNRKPTGIEGGLRMGLEKILTEVDGDEHSKPKL
jgi:acyl-CoA thioester hydrolase